MEFQPGDEAPSRLPRKPFSYCVRGALLVLIVGYVLDLYLGRSIVASTGVDANMVVSWTPDPDNPVAQMSLATAMLVGLGHLLLFFSMLLWVLGVVPKRALSWAYAGDRFALAVGFVGIWGILTLLLGNQVISPSSFTYIETLALDLVATLAILAGAIFLVKPCPSGALKGTLYSAGLATAVVASTVFIDTTNVPWLLVIVGASGLLALLRISQLLELYAQGPSTARNSEEFLGESI